MQIVLYPAAEPRPALKYQLLPPFLERRPGNAAVWWNRIPAERSGFFNKLYAEDGPWSRIEKWMEIPIGDPREKAYREKELANDIGMIQRRPDSSPTSSGRRNSSRATGSNRSARAISSQCSFPEIQQARSTRGCCRPRRIWRSPKASYDDAVRTLQCGYAEARHVAQSPTLVSGLVGVTIAGMMSYQVQQFIQQPDAPNLYWALSTLPRPLVDMPAGRRGGVEHPLSAIPRACATWTRRNSRRTSGAGC